MLAFHAHANYKKKQLRPQPAYARPMPLWTSQSILVFNVFVCISGKKWEKVEATKHHLMILHFKAGWQCASEGGNTDRSSPSFFSGGFPIAAIGVCKYLYWITWSIFLLLAAFADSIWHGHLKVYLLCAFVFRSCYLQPPGQTNIYLTTTCVFSFMISEKIDRENLHHVSHLLCGHENHPSHFLYHLHKNYN